MDNRILTIVYTFFLGLILALFIGLGISTFYSAPKMPDYPTEAMYYNKEPTAEQTRAQKDYDKASKSYSTESQLYSRNVSMLALVGAVLLLVISFGFEKRSQVIANGMLLGGVFTLLYSIIRGFVSEDSKYTFITVTVGLVIALYLGYRRFSQPPVAKKKKS